MSFVAPNRRHFMKHVAGAAAIAVPGMSFVTQLKAAETAAKKQGKSLIILWMGGGPPTIDIWDMKPGASTGGEHKPISTTAAGVQISEHLPTVAKQAKHMAVIRSLNSREGDHDRGSYAMHTGRSPNPLLQFPHIGSIVSLKNGDKDQDLPGFMTVGGTPDIGPGFLGMTYAAFGVQNPGQLPENIASPMGVDAERMARRAGIFESIEAGFVRKAGTPANPAKAHADIYGKAFKLVGGKGNDVFKFNDKDTKDLERYGATGFGRGCLQARKLVEAGAVCVEVDNGGWDLHNGVFPALARKLPEIDKGMGSLIEDLAQSGKLKDTVVLWMGDFGRTPRINQNAGRDHWSRCWSVAVAGGNIKGGQVYGATNDDGTDIKDNECSVLELFATVYQALGIDPTPESNASVRDNLGRPFLLAGESPKPIKALVG